MSIHKREVFKKVAALEDRVAALEAGDADDGDADDGDADDGANGDGNADDGDADDGANGDS